MRAVSIPGCGTLEPAMPADDVIVRFVVEGRVQGVFFRASMQAQAARLGVRGYARNLPDGRVEALVAGSRDAVESLAGWLAVGPPAARVDRVERTPVPAADAATIGDSFEVRH